MLRHLISSLVGDIGQARNMMSLLSILWMQLQSIDVDILQSVLMSWFFLQPSRGLKRFNLLAFPLFAFKFVIVRILAHVHLVRKSSIQMAGYLFFFFFFFKKHKIGSVIFYFGS